MGGHRHESEHVNEIKVREAQRDEEDRPRQRGNDRRQDRNDRNGRNNRNDADEGTLVSVVFVTAPKTFEGPAEFVTRLDIQPQVGAPVQFTRPATREAEPTQDQPRRPAPTPVRDEEEDEEDERQQDRQPTRETERARPTPVEAEETEVAPRITSASSLSASGASRTSDIVAEITSSARLGSSRAVPSSGVASAESSSATSTPTAEEATSTGMTSGAKAGVALGVLLAIGALLALILVFCRRKRKQREHQRLEDEKSEMAAAAPPPAMARTESVATARTHVVAPRLSLRPLTEFLPNLGGERKSVGDKLDTMLGPPAPNEASRYLQTPPPSAGSPRSLSPTNNANDPSNPFGNHAETVDPAAPRPVPSSQNPAAHIKTDTLGLIAGLGPLAAPPNGQAPPRAPANAPPAVRGPPPFHGPNPDMPKTISMTSDASIPIGMAGSLYQNSNSSKASVGQAVVAESVLVGGPNNVHRVQLDFKPSMEDELELRAGSLVRMLHEYDDGWVSAS